MCILKIIYLSMHILFLLIKRGDRMTDSDELAKALCRLFAEIAEKEKRKAIESDDYGTAFVAAVFEGLFNEARRPLD